MIDRLSQDFGFLQQAIALREQRQEVLSSNIANADTPDYKARDFDFKTAMTNAMDQRMKLANTNLTLTSPRHIPGKAVMPSDIDMMYRLPYQPSIDGNTVDMDMERVQFADNTMHYESSLQLLSIDMKTLQQAIQQS
ncbi:flagellar basal body rod protein FlgB [Dyella sp.]|uniref:flagellar basal body rod protein FlgB n=1 Tax=Dyella sp. TaxID=1869338 RepID=UPI002ED2B8AE